MAGRKQSKTLELRKSLNQAELHAKQREEINLNVVNQEELRANQRGFTIVKQKEVNRTKFSQTINENIAYLAQAQYLSSAEFSFVFTLSPMLRMGSNAIVNPKTDQYCSVSEIAEYLKRSRSKTSIMISSLIEKGIMYEFANIHEMKVYGRHVTMRPFFLNPEIICCGDKNKLESGIVQLMIHFNILEKSGVKLPIKAALKPHAKYGKLVTRKTFLDIQRGKCPRRF
ncbi:hypothetical protein J1TS5_04240 [Paenibacillus macerans]|uniref:hypothetical protein n=1 Tax=Paenibacillus macerans TaxID=44252 RepID=UPI001B1CD777|nr:hypothetical protein [Paenibacillus macerans]GIP08254.1 hypothetical protein J1TS5_04240 [Paenibacillus macerans]